MTNCIQCDLEMRRVVESGVSIDVCDGCHGTWLDSGELQSLTGYESAVRDSHSAQPNSASRCPRCRNHGLATATALSETVLQCTHCEGIFVDGAVLDRLLGHCENSSVIRGTGGTLTVTAELLNGLAEFLRLA